MKTKYLMLCALFAALTAIGAFLKIPIIPGVPFTLQQLFVFFAGLLLRPKYALTSQLVYIAIGLAGIPIFTNGGGLSYVFQPSFGFLIGFAVCALLVSLLIRKNVVELNSPKDNKKRVVLISKIVVFSLLSITVVYVFGITHWYIIQDSYLGNPIAVSKLISMMTPFFALDLVKFVIAVLVSVQVFKRLPKDFLTQK